MNHIQLLEKIKTAFANHQDGGNRYHYPKALKADAISLLKYYSAPELSHQLGISIKSLRNWDKGLHVATEASPLFVPVSLNKKTSSLNSPPVESIILKLPHNLELILPSTSMKDTAQFIGHLIKEITACSI